MQARSLLEPGHDSSCLRRVYYLLFMYYFSLRCHVTTCYTNELSRTLYDLFVMPVFDYYTYALEVRVVVIAVYQYIHDYNPYLHSDPYPFVPVLLKVCHGIRRNADVPILDLISIRPEFRINFLFQLCTCHRESQQ